MADSTPAFRSVSPALTQAIHMGSHGRRHIVHMTSVHDPRDPRIFLKECQSLAEAGNRVTLVAAVEESKMLDGVELLAVGKPHSRLSRMVHTTPKVYQTALALDADIYHFHDPELIPSGLKLARRGKKVVYDIHEDYYTAILQKRYLPAPARKVIAAAFRKLEERAYQRLASVIAESYYAEKFPNATEVLNYPIVDERLLAAPGCDPASNKLLYTGNVTKDRGALHHAALLGADDELDVHLMGRCSSALAAELRELAGPGATRLVIEGEGSYLDPATIQEAYIRGGWLAGLALFPDTKHYRRKILTKMFEYMAAGLPVICSNFPTWKRLIDETGCGIAVDPEQPEHAIEAISYLKSNPDEAREMGRRGREAVITRYNWASEFRKLADLYERLLHDKQ